MCLLQSRYWVRNMLAASHHLCSILKMMHAFLHICLAILPAVDQEDARQTRPQGQLGPIFWFFSEACLSLFVTMCMQHAYVMNLLHICHIIYGAAPWDCDGTRSFRGPVWRRRPTFASREAMGYVFGVWQKLIKVALSCHQCIMVNMYCKKNVKYCAFVPHCN